MEFQCIGLLLPQLTLLLVHVALLLKSLELLGELLVVVLQFVDLVGELFPFLVPLFQQVLQFVDVLLVGVDLL